MTWPTPTVEVAPTTYGAPPLDRIAWTDITDTAMEADISLGRTDALSDFGAGTMSLRMTAPATLPVAALSMTDGSVLNTANGELTGIESSTTFVFQACMTAQWSTGTPCSAYSTSADYGFRIEDGIIHINAYADVASPRPVSFSDGDTGWIRAIATDGEFSGALFYESYDGRNWTCLGTGISNTSFDPFAAGYIGLSCYGSAALWHSLSIGHLDDSGEPVWLVGWDFTVHGLAEQIAGYGDPDEVYGSAEMVSSDEEMEPGWYVRLRWSADDLEGTAFTGRVTSVVKSPQAGQTFVSLEATDLTEALASAALARSAYATRIEADSPLAFWPLRPDSAGTPSQTARYTTGLVDGRPDGSLSLAGPGDWIRDTARIERSGQFSIEFWIKTRTSVTQNAVAPIFAQGATGSLGRDLTVSLTAEGLLFGVAGSAVVATRQISDGRPHHVVCLLGSSQDIYIDGEQVTGGGSTLISARWRTDYFYETVIGWRSKNTWNVPVTGTLDDAAVYGYALHPLQIREHYRLGMSGEAPDTLAGRVRSLAAQAGFDGSWLDIDPSAETEGVYTQPVDEGTVLGELQALAQAHGARIHSTGDGTLAAFGADWYPEPSVSLTDDGTGTDYLAAGFETEQTRDDIANVVTGSQADGPAVTVSDPNSIGRYGRQQRDLGTIRATSPGAVQTIAERHLDRDRLPRERFRSIAVAATTANADALAGATVSAVVDVTRDGDTSAFTVEGTSLSIAPESWRLTCHLSPKDPDDFWRWGESTLDADARWW
jgi:hypothetical protein